MEIINKATLKGFLEMKFDLENHNDLEYIDKMVSLEIRAIQRLKKL